jgi:hypothetical protein
MTELLVSGKVLWPDGELRPGAVHVAGGKIVAVTGGFEASAHAERCLAIPAEAIIKVLQPFLRDNMVFLVLCRLFTRQSEQRVDSIYR